MTTSSTTIDISKVSGLRSADTFIALKFTQGGRTWYQLNLSPYDITRMFPLPDPERPQPGNRRVKLKHAQDFGTYFRFSIGAVAGAMIVRAEDVLESETILEHNDMHLVILSIDRLTLADLYYMDGQHRGLGFHEAYQAIASELSQLRNELGELKRNYPEQEKEHEKLEADIADLEHQRRRWHEERVAVLIVEESDIKSYMQMFDDVAENALGISHSIKVVFDSRKVVNRAAQMVIEQRHPLIDGRLDLEADRPRSGYLVSAKMIADLARITAKGIDGRISKRDETVLKDADLAVEIKHFLSNLLGFASMKAVQANKLPVDDLKQTSLLGSVTFLRVLAGVHHDLLGEGWSDVDIKAYFADLEKHLEAPVEDEWILESGVIEKGSLAPGARTQDVKALVAYIIEDALGEE